MKGRIVIDFERCKGCGLCVDVCAKGCIYVSDKANQKGFFPAQTTNENCNGCAMCAIMCPDTAIEVFRQSPQTSEKKERIRTET